MMAVIGYGLAVAIIGAEYGLARILVSREIEPPAWALAALGVLVAVAVAAAVLTPVLLVIA